MRGVEAISAIAEKVESRENWRLFGEALRRERELRGISLDHIARETKYSVHQLRRLEAGDQDSFEARVFLEGAVRGYARSIGADSDQMHLHLLEVLQTKEAGADAERHVGFIRRLPPAARGLLLTAAILAAIAVLWGLQ